MIGWLTRRAVPIAYRLDCANWRTSFPITASTKNGLANPGPAQELTFTDPHFIGETQLTIKWQIVEELREELREESLQSGRPVVPTKASAAHTMLKLKRGSCVAFAEREHRNLLVELRQTDARMRGGRITEVLQCLPSAVIEGTVYEGS